MVFGVIENPNIQIGEALLISLVAIAIVFCALLVIILISGGIQKGMHAVDSKNHIMPREENKILDEDEDAAVAAIVATIDFYKETGKNAHLVSITKLED